MTERSVSYLVSAALARSEYGSNRKLAPQIGVCPKQITVYLRDQVIPKDEVLFRLCNLANEPYLPWLFWAHRERNDGKIAEIWDQALELVTREASKEDSPPIAEHLENKG